MKRTFDFAADADGERIEGTMTVENETWNESVAQGYAAHRLFGELGVSMLDLDSDEIEVAL